MATVCYNDLNLVLNCDREIYKIFFWSRQQILQNKTSWPFFCDKVVLNQTYRHIQALKKELKWDPFLGLFGFLWGLFFTWWAQKNSLEPRKGWGAVGSKSLDFNWPCQYRLQTNPTCFSKPNWKKEQTWKREMWWKVRSKL